MIKINKDNKDIIKDYKYLVIIGEVTKIFDIFLADVYYVTDDYTDILNNSKNYLDVNNIEIEIYLANSEAAEFAMLFWFE